MTISDELRHDAKIRETSAEVDKAVIGRLMSLFPDTVAVLRDRTMIVDVLEPADRQSLQLTFKLVIQLSPTTKKEPQS